MWDRIKKELGDVCLELPAPTGFGTVYLLQVPPRTNVSPSFWMVGEYRQQRKFARHLRSNKVLQNFVTTCQTRFGMRATDRPPEFVAAQESFGDTVQGADFATNFVRKRLRSWIKPLPGGALWTNRRTDREENVRTYWQTQTPQSHHIVEFNHLEAINASKKRGGKPLDRQQLPCVLLAAELHQFYVTQFFVPTRSKDENKLRRDLWNVYKTLYYERSGALFQPLWDVAQIVLDEAGVSAA